MVNAPKGYHSKGLENVGKFVGGKNKKFLTHRQAKAGVAKTSIMRRYKKVLRKEGYADNQGIESQEDVKSDGVSPHEAAKKKSKAPHPFMKDRRRFKAGLEEKKRLREEKDKAILERREMLEKSEKLRAKRLQVHTQKTKTGQPNLCNRIKLMLEKLQGEQ